MAIVLAAALTSVGCATGKVRVSGSKMCQAHGGSYNATTKTCSYTAASTKSVRESCQQQDGYWDDAAGFCDEPSVSTTPNRTWALDPSCATGHPEWKSRSRKPG